MRQRVTIRDRSPLLGALLAAALLAVEAEAVEPVSVSGHFEVGVRDVSGDDDSAKFDEYRYVNEGLFGSGDLLYQDPSGRYWLRLGGYDLGEDDADYFLEGGRWGQWGLSSSLSLIPHDFSQRGLSPYRGFGSGMLTLPFARPPADLDAAVSGAARDADLDFRTLDGEVSAFFRPAPGWDLSARYRLIDRDGRRPEQLFFGFSNFVHHPQPVDERVHEGSADIRYTADDWSLGLNYTANFFDNDFRSFSVDNPLIGVAVDGDTDVGRVSAAPDNSSHLVSLTGTTLLPTPFVSRLAATFAYGMHRQDQSFVPMTANSALSGDPRLDLPESSLDGDVRTMLANVVLTARPHPELQLTGRYRFYDYDNDTDTIIFTAAVVDDNEIEDRTLRTLTPSYRKQNASLEASYDLTERTSASLGLGWEQWHRSHEREVRRLDEYRPELWIDHRVGAWARLRVGYDFATRHGTSYDELAPFRQLEPGDVPSSLDPPIRAFDQADSREHGFHLISHFYPCASTDVTLTGNFRLTDYVEGAYGLLDADRWDVGVEVTHRLHERVELSAWYTYDSIYRRQRSASSGNQRWTSHTDDDAHTGGAEVALALVPGKLTWTNGYFIQDANGRTHTSGVPSDAVDYPDIDDRLQAVTSEFRYRATEQLTLGLGYRYERYEQDDWQFDGLGVTSASSTVGAVGVSGSNDVYLRNGLEDYDAHIVSLSAMLSF